MAFWLNPMTKMFQVLPMKLVLTVLAIVALLAAGFAFYKFAGGGVRLGPRTSPSAIPENASPAGEELMRTPELGIEFWQRDQKNLMFASQDEKRITRVLLKRVPFEMRCPHSEGDVQICAWSDASIFDVSSVFHAWHGNGGSTFWPVRAAFE